MSDKENLSSAKSRRTFTFSPAACYSALALFSAALIVCFLLIDSMAPAGRRLAKIAGIDPAGYFGLAHSLVFDHDFDLSNEFQRVPPGDNLWTRVQSETGHPGTVWPIGYSLWATPFLAAGTALDGLAGNPADGYSRFAMLGYCLTNVVLTCVGLFALFTLLHEVAMLWGVGSPQSGGYALLVTGATFFGTSVGYYAFSQMSHASEFCFMSLFLRYWWKFRERGDLRSWAILGLIGGALSITRWQDALYLGAPVLFNAMERGLKKDIGLRLRNFAVYGGVVAFCWIPECLELRYMFGRLLLVAPLSKGYFVFPPQFVPQVLFSSRAGWFLWTPLAFLGFCGLLMGLVKMTRVFLPWIVAFALEVALIGSAVTWHGGDSFSSRYLTSGTPLISIGLITILCLSTAGIRRIAIAGIVACCMFAALFALQFRLDLVPRDDQLTVAECFTDKLRLPQVRRRKLVVQKAQDLMQQGSPEAAVQSLEDAARTYGVDRDLLSVLAKAYRKSGREAEADSIDKQRQALMASKLF